MAGVLKQAREALRDKRYDDALAATREALKTDRKSVMAFVLTGAAYAGLGNAERSELAYRKALELAPGPKGAVALQGLVQLYESVLKDPAKTAAALADLVAVLPEDTPSEKLREYAVRRAEALSQAGDAEEAGVAWIALAQDPPDQPLADKVAALLRASDHGAAEATPLALALVDQADGAVSLAPAMRWRLAEMQIRALRAVSADSTQQWRVALQRYPWRPEPLHALWLNIEAADAAATGLALPVTGRQTRMLAARLVHTFPADARAPLLCALLRNATPSPASLAAAPPDMLYCWVLACVKHRDARQPQGAVAAMERVLAILDARAIPQPGRDRVAATVRVAAAEALLQARSTDRAAQVLQPVLAHSITARQCMVRVHDAAGTLPEAESMLLLLQEDSAAHVAAYALSWLGWLRRQQQRTDDARALLEQAVATNAQDGTAHFRLASVLWQAGDRSTAHKHLLLAAKHAPRLARAWTLLGVYYADEVASVSKAQRCLARALDLDPRDAEAGQRLSLLLPRDKAVAMWQRVTATAARVPWAWGRLAHWQLEQRQLDQAVASFQAALRHDTDTKTLWLGLGEAYRLQGKYLAAERALQRVPDLPRAQHQLGLVYHDLARYPEAVECYLASDCDAGRVNAAASLLAHARDLRLARADGACHESLRQAMTLVQDVRQSYRSKGVAPLCLLHKLHADLLVELGVDSPRDSAATSLRHALRADPSCAAYWRDLALLTQQRAPAAAAAALAPAQFESWLALACVEADTAAEQRYLGVALRLAPNNAQVWLALASWHHRHARYGLAQRAVLRAQSLDPSNAYVWLLLGVLNLGVGAVRHARAAFLQASSLRGDLHAADLGAAYLGDHSAAWRVTPQSPDAVLSGHGHVIAGIALYRHRHFDRAAQHLQRAAELLQTSDARAAALARVNLARALSARGAHAQACHAVQAAAPELGDLPVVRRVHAVVLALAGRGTEALALLDESDADLLVGINYRLQRYGEAMKWLAHAPLAHQSAALALQQQPDALAPHAPPLIKAYADILAGRGSPARAMLRALRQRPFDAGIHTRCLAVLLASGTHGGPAARQLAAWPCATQHRLLPSLAALLGGDTPAARRGFAAELRRDPTQQVAWIGLAAATSHPGAAACAALFPSASGVAAAWLACVLDSDSPMLPVVLAAQREDPQVSGFCAAYARAMQQTRDPATRIDGVRALATVAIPSEPLLHPGQVLADIDAICRCACWSRTAAVARSISHGVAANWPSTAMLLQDALHAVAEKKLRAASEAVRTAVAQSPDVAACHVVAACVQRALKKNSKAKACLSAAMQTASSQTEREAIAAVTASMYSA